MVCMSSVRCQASKDEKWFIDRVAIRRERGGVGVLGRVGLEYLGKELEHGEVNEWDGGFEPKGSPWNPKSPRQAMALHGDLVSGSPEL